MKTFWISRISFGGVVVALCMLSIVGSAARADTVELVNGDTLSGRVISLDARDLTLESEAIGTVTLARSKVAVVYLGDRKPAPVATQGYQAGLTRTGAGGAAIGSPDDLVRHLQQKGAVDPSTMAQLEKQFPMLALPEVRSYFDETMGGLISGTRSLSDVRKDAVKARDELLELQKDLGPNGQMLNGYLSILNKFIRETEPAPAETASETGSEAKQTSPSAE